MFIPLGSWAWPSSVPACPYFPVFHIFPTRISGALRAPLEIPAPAEACSLRSQIFTLHSYFFFDRQTHTYKHISPSQYQIDPASLLFSLFTFCPLNSQYCLLFSKFWACFLTPYFILCLSSLRLYLTGTYFTYFLGSLLFSQCPQENIFSCEDHKLLPSFETHPVLIYYL